jgi:hypothetical protein
MFAQLSDRVEPSLANKLRLKRRCLLCSAAYNDEFSCCKNKGKAMHGRHATAWNSTSLRTRTVPRITSGTSRATTLWPRRLAGTMISTAVRTRSLSTLRGCPIEFYLFPSRLCVHVDRNQKLQYTNSDKVILE